MPHTKKRIGDFIRDTDERRDPYPPYSCSRCDKMIEHDRARVTIDLRDGLYGVYHYHADGCSELMHRDDTAGA